MGASRLAAAMPARPRCSPPSQPPTAPSSAGSSSPAFSVACLLFGLAGFLAADAAVSRGSTGVAPRGRCPESSHPLSVSVAWDWRPRDAADASTAELPASLATGSRRRYKVMAFVGIFTGFGFVGRRRALRRTWLPADRQFSQSVFAERRRLLASSLVSSISATPRATAWPRRAGRLRKTSWSSEMPWKHLASTHTGLAKQITEQLKAKQYADAEKSWRDLESAVQENSNGVNFYNFLKDESSENAATTQRKRSFASFSKNGYSKCLSSNVTREGDLDGLMNTVIKNKLRIIPKNVSWREQSDDVFEALAGDFMKPRIHEVDELLKLGVDVTIYSGQPKTKAYTYI